MLIGAGKMGELAARHLLAQRRRRHDRHQPHLRPRRRAGARVRRHAGAVRALRRVPAARRHRDRLDGRGRLPARACGRARGAARAQAAADVLHRPGRAAQLRSRASTRSTTSTSTTSTTSAAAVAEQPRRARTRGARGGGDRRRARSRRFWRWLAHLDVVPTIVALREKVEAIRRAELREDARVAAGPGAARSAQRLDALTDVDRQQDPARAALALKQAGRAERGVLRRRGAPPVRPRAPDGRVVSAALRIGTRGSALALAQARHGCRGRSSGAAPARVELVMIRTSGDRLARRAAQRSAAKGLFVKEIEEALLARRDRSRRALAEGPARAVAGGPGVRGGAAARGRARRAVVGDGLAVRHRRRCRARRAASARRAACRRARASSCARARPRPRRCVAELRGNVDTRLRKLAAGEVDALVLAAAGLDRLGVAPAGAVAARARRSSCRRSARARWRSSRGADDAAIRAVVAALDDPPTAVAVAAERAFLAAVGGDCQTPLAAHATVVGRSRVRCGRWSRESTAARIIARRAGRRRGACGGRSARDWRSASWRAVRPGSSLAHDPGAAYERRVTRPRHLVGAGPGEPGLLTLRGRRCLEERRRRRLRLPRRTPRCSPTRGRRRAHLRRQARQRRAARRRRRSSAHRARPRARRQMGRPPQRRRPVRLRARRRGGARVRARRHPVRGRPGCDLGGGRARLCRHPAHPSRPGVVGDLRHRPRGREARGRVPPAMGGARAPGRHARALHERPPARGESALADRSRPRPRHAGRGRALGHDGRAGGDRGNGGDAARSRRGPSLAAAGGGGRRRRRASGGRSRMVSAPPPLRPPHRGDTRRARKRAPSRRCSRTPAPR